MDNNIRKIILEFFKGARKLTKNNKKGIWSVIAGISLILALQQWNPVMTIICFFIVFAIGLGVTYN